MTSLLEKTARAVVTSHVPDTEAASIPNNSTTWWWTEENLTDRFGSIDSAAPAFEPATFADATIQGVSYISAGRFACFKPVGLTSIVDAAADNVARSDLSHLSGSWRSSVRGGSRRLMKFELLEQAAKQLTRLIASGGVRANQDQLRNVGTFVTSFVVDGGPSPQIAATEFGAVEVAWVVGKSAVGAIFDDEGSYSVWAQDWKGDELFDLDLEDAMSTGLQETIAAQLCEMSTRVRLAIPAV